LIKSTATTSESPSAITNRNKKSLKISQICRRMGAHLGVYFDGVLDSVRLGVYLGGVFIGEDLVIVFHGAEQQFSKY
jgi:hypothetical protein